MRVGDVRGRDAWLTRLASLPPVALLRAPASTGKRTAAQAVLRAAGVSPEDQLWLPALEYLDEYGKPVSPDDERRLVARVVEPELTITHVRELIAWARTMPLASSYKVAVVRLDHVRADGSTWAASSRTLAAMLKLLEEPPARSRFILLATRPTLPMIRSRCVELTAGALPSEVVADILFAVSDLSESESRAAAALGGGRVAPSLALRSSAEGSKQAVVDALTSLAAGDLIALTEKSRIWTETDTDMLARWAQEHITGRYVVFAGVDTPKVSLSAAERVLRIVRESRGARPRVVLGAVSTLAGVL